MLSRREEELDKEEHAKILRLRKNLGSVGKNAVLESGALLCMMQVSFAPIVGLFYGLEDSSLAPSCV